MPATKNSGHFLWLKFGNVRIFSYLCADESKSREMKTEKLNRLYRAALQKLLVLLGFGTTFVFMACYGPAPSHADAVADEELFVLEDSADIVEETDSITQTELSEQP